MTERHALIAANRVPGIGAARVRAVIGALGSLAAARDVSPEDLAAACPGLGPQRAAALAETLRSDFAEREEERAAKQSVRIVTWEDPEYPESLRACDAQTPPLALYCVGDAALLRQTQVALIGTRRASVYGMEQAKRFALRLAQAGIHVTSGLAEGIDSAAHEGALLAGREASGRTVACVGAALDELYPSSRKPLARQIVRGGGLVVSEYPFGRHADAQTFPQRNRIVASLAKAVMVVESPSRSGTLITVDYAMAYGRQIYVLPGRADTPSFTGNHRLLREDAGRLVTAAEQIIDDFGELDLREGRPVQAAPEIPPGLDPTETQLYTALGRDECTLDELAGRTGLPMPTVMATVIALQMRRRLRALPGGRVARADR